MAKRRGNHEGSIHQLPSGTFRAQVTLQGQRLSFTAHTKRLCQDWLKNTNRQIDDGLLLVDTKITLNEYLNNWLISTKSSKRHSTWAHYEQVTRSYILPRIGQVKVKDLRPEHIQGLYNYLLEQRVGEFTVLKIHTVLHSALQQAVRMGIIGRNPASLTNPPKEPDTEMAILNESQVSQFLIAAMTHRWEGLFHLAIVTGARQMELLGLKWTDLDWLRQTLKVERQLVRPNGSGVQFSSPKTKFGKRSIALGSKTIDVLRKHYERQQVERIAAGEKWQEHGLIFTTSQGRPINPRNLLRDFKTILRNAGLPDIRFHDLRHTAASLMLNNNIPPIVVSRRLGHAKASITLDIYGHLIPSMQIEAAEKIDELITPILMAPKIVDIQQNVPGTPSR
jgi:integrase